MTAPRAVLVVLRKELRETLRDRRTLAVMVLLPLVVYPVVSLLVTEVMAAKRLAEEARPSRVAVVAAATAGKGGDGAAAAVAAVRANLTGKKDIQLVDTATDADVGAGRVDAIVTVGERPAPAALPAAGAPAAPAPVGLRPLRIVHDQTREASAKAQARLDSLLGAVMPPGCAPAYAVDGRSVAPRQKVGAYVLSKILPLLVVVMTMLGAFYPAIDITAGERERGTLETLLATPVRRLHLMTGKVLAVAVLATLTGVLNIATMSLTVITGASLGGVAGALEIPWTRAVATALTVVPAAFLFASVMVAIGAVARSFKEAQNLLAPIYFLCLVPALVAGLGDFPLAGAVMLAPGVNLTLLARDLMLAAATPLAAAVVIASTLAYGGVALALAARLYDSERLLTAADASRVPLGAWLRHLLGRAPDAGATPEARAAAALPPAEPTAGHALALFALAYVLSFFLFSRLQQWRVIPGLLLSQWLGFGGLVWAYARLCRRPLRAVVGVYRPGGWSIAGATLIGLSGCVILGVLVDRLMPPPRELVEEMRRLIHPPGGDRPLALSLLALAVTPAICEEALFRGPILKGLAQRLSAPAACLLTGLLFGVLHGSIWRFLPTAALGAVLSWITLSSGSVLPAMLAHTLHNGVLVVLGHFRLDEPGGTQPPAGGGTQEIAIAAGACLLAVLGVLAVRRGRIRSPQPL